jgi:IS5 family transposase
MSRALARLARKAGICLRQRYIRVAKVLLVSQSRYAHAKQYGRAKRSEMRLRVILGQLLRDIGRKLTQCFGKQRPGLEALLALGEQLWKQQRKDKNKLYSVHEPYV